MQEIASCIWYYQVEYHHCFTFMSLHGTVRCTKGLVIGSFNDRILLPRLSAQLIFTLVVPATRKSKWHKVKGDLSETTWHRMRLFYEIHLFYCVPASSQNKLPTKFHFIVSFMETGWVIDFLIDTARCSKDKND